MAGSPRSIRHIGGPSAKERAQEKAQHAPPPTEQQNSAHEAQTGSQKRTARHLTLTLTLPYQRYQYCQHFRLLRPLALLGPSGLAATSDMAEARKFYPDTAMRGAAGRIQPYFGPIQLHCGVIQYYYGLIQPWRDVSTTR